MSTDPQITISARAVVQMLHGSFGAGYAEGLKASDYAEYVDYAAQVLTVDEREQVGRYMASLLMSRLMGDLDTADLPVDGDR